MAPHWINYFAGQDSNPNVSPEYPLGDTPHRTMIDPDTSQIFHYLLECKQRSSEHERVCQASGLVSSGDGDAPVSISSHHLLTPLTKAQAASNVITVSDSDVDDSRGHASPPKHKG